MFGEERNYIKILKGIFFCFEDSKFFYQHKIEKEIMMNVEFALDGAKY